MTERCTFFEGSSDLYLIALKYLGRYLIWFKSNEALKSQFRPVSRLILTLCTKSSLAVPGGS